VYLAYILFDKKIEIVLSIYSIGKPTGFQPPFLTYKSFNLVPLIKNHRIRDVIDLFNEMDYNNTIQISLYKTEVNQ